jgi:hypothetical protein
MAEEVSSSWTLDLGHLLPSFRPPAPDNHSPCAVNTQAGGRRFLLKKEKRRERVQFVLEMFSYRRPQRTAQKTERNSNLNNSISDLYEYYRIHGYVFDCLQSDL